MKSKQKLPHFVWFGKSGCCAMRLEWRDEKTQGYWRDGGGWGTNFTLKEDGALLSSGHSRKEFGYLNNKLLIPCSEKEWRKSNSGYAPSKEDVKHARIKPKHTSWSTWD